MQVLISVVALWTATAATASAPVNEFDKQKLIPVIAVENCKHIKKASAKRKRKAIKVAKILYQVEEELLVPPEMRGMTLAAACLESGFNPNALGDRKFSKSGKRPMAVGVLQMWRVYEKAYKTDRKDPRSSAIGWLTHIKRLIPKVKRRCKYRTTRRIWKAAWVTGIRYPKPGGRCKETPNHYKYFLKIRRIYDAQTRKSFKNSGK